MHFPGLTVTAYCERSSHGFWAEPLNALSNLALVLVAVLMLARLWRKHYPLIRAWDLWVLSGLIGVAGVGSFLWHTFARPWAEWLDVLPILIYISLYLISFLLRVARISLRKAIVWFLGFHAVNVLLLLTIPGTALNGSAFYLPSLAMLAILAHFDRKLLLAAAVFALALVFRGFDRAICPWIPLGTHFLWHLLISLTVYMTTAGLLNASFSDQR